MLKVSVITVSLNSEKYMESCIKSVISQDYKNIEYIIIDGKSTDSTLKIAEKYKNNIDILVSEPDKGIFDAMNKGIKLATGDIIAILNSDDYYSDNSVISTVVKEFETYNTDSVFGNISIISPFTSKVIRKWRDKKYKRKNFKKGWHPAHPAFFVKREIYEKFGVFNLKYRIAADYELMFRFLYKNKVTSKMTDKKAPLVIMRAGGNSNASVRNIIKSNLEARKAWTDNEISPPLFLISGKIFYKIRQLKLYNLWRNK